ncbi:MAG: cysteinyl-tRNA synthetase [Chloroflexi bacterium]|nr:cysteinyl-tRNA synthetase [Chloroflexota bacterium]
MGRHLSRLGKVVLFGSGETTAAGRRIHEQVLSTLKLPIKVAILETPAGFEPNSDRVAQKVADFVRVRLQNFKPEVSVIPARSRHPPFSTDDAKLLAPMLEANYVFAGPGSPTYMARHMAGSLALSYLVGRHRRGAAVALASAAAIAISSKCLPVYEIFKAGHDLHWVDGLDFFNPFGLELAIVTHWDNQEGGAEVDTRHCFMGRTRMEALRGLLPRSTVVLGVDEATGLVFDFQAESCQVLGSGGVTILSAGSEESFGSGSTIPMQRLGPYHAPEEEGGCGPYVQMIGEEPETEGEVPQEVLALVQRREELRRARSYAEADVIRQQAAELGYEIEDTRDGARLRKKTGQRAA